jgi:hypothetical protein
MTPETPAKPLMTMIALAGFWLTVTSQGPAPTPANDNLLASNSGTAPSGTTPPQAS